MESSETHIETAFGPIDAIEDCYSRGWTDGLPVVPPTPERVAALLDYVTQLVSTVLIICLVLVIVLTVLSPVQYA